MSKSVEFGSDITGKIKEAIKSKLAELGSYIDEELPDYIMIMIANRKNKAQLVEDLQLFLSTNTDSFVDWLLNMLQEYESESASRKKTEKQPSVDKLEQKKSVDSASMKSRSESDESSAIATADLITTSSETNLEVSEKTEDLSASAHHHHHHHHHHHKRRESTSAAEDEPKPGVKNARRRAVEEVPISRKPARRSRSRSRSPRRKSKSRSRSPRGSHYSKRVVASVLASRREDKKSNSQEDTLRKVERKKSRTSDSGNSDGEEERKPDAPSSSVKVPQRKAGGLQATTSLLMRAIAEAKSSIENVPQSEIKVPPNSTVVADKTKHTAEPTDDHSDDIREIIRRERRRGGVRGDTDQSDSRASKSLRVISTADGGFITRSKQARIQQEEKKKVITGLLQQQLEKAEREIEESENDKVSSDSELDPEKKKEADEAVKAFNRDAVKDKSIKTVENSLNNQAEDKAGDILVKALFQSTDQSDAIPSNPGRNNPQFIVTMEGIDETKMLGHFPPTVNVASVKPPMSERLAPRSNTLLQNRLGPPVDSNQTDDMDTQVNDNNGKAGEAEMEVSTRPPERCRFWPKCKSGDSCPFVHPSQPCKMFPSCRFGARCLYIHPDCKFDTTCLNPECPFTHRGNAPQLPAQPTVVASTAQLTVGTTPDTADMETTVPTPTTTNTTSTAPSNPATSYLQSSVPLCKFFPNCTNPFCLFSHPKPCRFGSNCYYKSTCTFWHPTTGPSSGFSSKLRWTAPSMSQNNSQSGQNGESNEPKTNPEPQKAATAVN